MPYIDRIQFLIDEQEAFVSAQAQIDHPITKNINEVVHNKVRQLVMNAPSVELTRVSYGYWSRSDKKGYYCRGHLCCSVCGKETRHMEGARTKKYCEHCGSIMDKEIHNAIDGVQMIETDLPENENGMKPCPFCGGEAEMHIEPDTNSWIKNADKIPEYAVNIRPSERREYKGAGIYRYKSGFMYTVKGFKPRCCDKKCLGRNSKVFHSEEEAKAAWNMRK